jgi:SAM-dependent methyltransferase
MENRKSYQSLVDTLKEKHEEKTAMSLSVGGSFDTIGLLERELLIQHGLQKDQFLIDIGCGSGRLAQALSGYLNGPYLGTDVVQDLLDYAQKASDRPDWHFQLTEGIHIPEKDACADMICFFSVFTHLLHEHSYAYLDEAKRVLKPGGTIVFSFLEFRHPGLWKIFEGMISVAGEEHPLCMFISRDAIEAWSIHLELEIVEIIDGEVPHIPLPHAVTFDDGTTIDGTGKLGPTGQPLCILKKPK